MPNLKTKYSDKNKPAAQMNTNNEKVIQFKAKNGREPITDSEIDEVYGVGSATKALDKVYKK